MAKTMNVEVHQTSQGMAVVLNKAALIAIKEGRVGQVDMVAGNKKMVLQLMRDSTFAKIKEQQAKQAQAQINAAALAKEAMNAAKDTAKKIADA